MVADPAVLGIRAGLAPKQRWSVFAVALPLAAVGYRADR